MFKQTFKITTTLIIFVAVLGACGGGSSGRSNPSTEQTAEFDASFDQQIADIMDNENIQGLSVGIVSLADGQQVIQTKGYGFSNVDQQRPVTADTSFWLASVSKPFLGTSIVIAQEQGFLDINDDVKTILDIDGVFTVNNPNDLDFNISHLMNHTSGIVDSEEYICGLYIDEGNGEHTKLVNYFFEEERYSPTSPVDLQLFLAAYLDSRGELYSSADNFLPSPPGENYEYANIGAALAGQIIDLTTGESLDSYAAQQIFTPLGMINTSWQYSNLDPINVATPYLLSDGELLALPNFEIRTWPDGGLRSSANDLSTFIATMINQGESLSQGVRILSEDSMNQMHAPLIDGYDYFWVHAEQDYGGENHLLIGHGGLEPGATTHMYFDPESKIGIVILANTSKLTNGEDLDTVNLDGLIVSLFEKASLL